MSWGAYIQGGDSFETVEFQGLRLSYLWDCAVHWPAFNKNEYEWLHNLCLPYYVVAGSEDVKLIRVHERFVELVKQKVSIYKAKEMSLQGR